MTEKALLSARNTIVLLSDHDEQDFGQPRDLRSHSSSIHSSSVNGI